MKLNRKENPSTRLGANLRRIFLERGLDFFDKISGDTFISDDPQAGPSNAEESTKEHEEKDEDEDEPKVMTYEDLRDMRDEILRNLA